MSDGLDKRAAILDAALDRFSEVGFHATTVPQVAEAARVALGTIYRYFPSKEALVNELYRVEKERLGIALLRGHPIDGPAREQFRHFWDQAIAYALDNPRSIRFLELHHHAPYLDAASREVESLSLLPLVHSLQRAIGQQVVKDLAPHLLIAIVWGAFLGVIKTVWEQRISPTPETFRAAEQCCWEAIRR
jgi:AcrR family transcriptional regulator